MCGIAGIAGNRRDGRSIVRMVEALRHRGPDGLGIARRKHVQLGASRLALLDLQHGSQPMATEDGAVTVVFNGEIYNHGPLREALRRRGHGFQSHCDTEVVLRLYLEYGPACVAQLQGMFAFAILDGDRLLLARDRLGIKPLHYAQLDSAGFFLFASEIKALLQHPALTPRLNMQAFVDWIALYQPGGPETFFEGVKMLPPGHTLTVNCSDRLIVSGPTPYVSSVIEKREPIPETEAERLLEGRLEQAVQTHMTADVDIGVCLSGGLDSTLLALLAKDLHPGRLKTFTVFPALAGQAHPDEAAAAYVAAQIQSDHVRVEVTFADFLAALPATVAASESPCTLSGAPFLLLNRRIAASVKGCLCGEGADELFGGYQEYADPEYMLGRLRNGIKTLAAAGLPPSNRALALLETLSQALARDEDAYFSEVLQANMQSQLERHHLEPIDKYAMAAGVEIRVPFLDNSVIDLVQALPLQYLFNRDLNVQKYLLRRVLLRRFGEGYLDIARREKRSLPSAADCFSAPFERLCREMVPARCRERHEFGRCFTTVSELVLFDLFSEIFLTHQGDASRVGTIEDFLASRYH